MQELELLSPAKNLECGICAIDHGADAVYIGARKFGARASAGNSTEDIAQLCTYAHRYGAKVYVTVNTIIYDGEMADTLQLIREMDSIGVDGILIQDMGLLSEMQKMNLHCHIHASTQTDNRTAEKVRYLRDLGIKRVVLARELSINEIMQIHEAVPEVELEVFVHGALCVSYSGQCYASQACFDRSANRGECAQFCRMKFDLIDADNNVIERDKHLLSLKDMEQINNLEKLIEAGAISFKIEGRLKDADYVKNVTAAYSERLNEICSKKPEEYCRASMGRCTYTFTPDIRKSFNRDFTTYFAKGRQQGIVNIHSPKALGEPVGKVKEIRMPYSFNVATTCAFNNGDGLCFFNDDMELVGFRVNKAEGNRLFPLKMPEGLKPGTMLYRNHDQAFETLLSKPSAERKIAVTMVLTVKENLLTLLMTDEKGNTYTASAPYQYQKAQKPQEDNIRRQLTKLGGTPYLCTLLTINSKVDSPFIPSSILSGLRQNLKLLEPLNNLETIESPSSETIKNLLPMRFPSLAKRGNRRESTGEGFLLNASNKEAKAFYAAQGIEATSFETDGGGNLLMQCRYCIRHEMGYCSKYARQLPWKEPLRLRLGDGRDFKLKFNCAKCQMEISKE